MSLDTKRAEIRKLEERILQREEVLPHGSCEPSNLHLTWLSGTTVFEFHCEISIRR